MKINRGKLVEQCAHKLTDVIDLKTLLRFFYESQYDWLDSLSPTELQQEARGLGLLKEEDMVEIV